MIVKWRWWYPVQSEDLEEHVFADRWPPSTGEEAAEGIVQDHIDSNGTDGCKSFEIEIVEPHDLAGIFDVEIEWSPYTTATERVREPA